MGSAGWNCADNKEKHLGSRLMLDHVTQSSMMMEDFSSVKPFQQLLENSASGFILCHPLQASCFRVMRASATSLRGLSGEMHGRSPNA